MPPWRVKPRFIEEKFDRHFFKPRGIPISTLKIHVLGHEELEALRLMDIRHMNQEDAAKLMGVSRRTFQRILEGAREKVTLTLINGNAIEIRGGHYTVGASHGGRHGRRGRNR